MAARLEVDADVAFNIAHALSNDAEELRAELSRLAREWGNVAHGWSGVAASGFMSLWEDWHEGAAELVDALAESSQRLARGAAQYAEQDAQSAETLDVPLAVEMGL